MLGGISGCVAVLGQRMAPPVVPSLLSEFGQELYVCSCLENVTQAESIEVGD